MEAQRQLLPRLGLELWGERLGYLWKKNGDLWGVWQRIFRYEVCYSCFTRLERLSLGMKTFLVDLRWVSKQYTRKQ